MMAPNILRLKSGQLYKGSISSAQYCFRTLVNLSYKIIENVTEASDNTPVFVLHDLLSSKNQWNGLGKTIHTITKRPIVTIDLRNHGKSPHVNSNKYEEMSADVQQLLDKLSVANAYFLGHGIGGKVAMVTALLAPQKVTGIIVVDVSPASSPSQFNIVYSKIMKSMSTLTFKGDKKLEIAISKTKKHLKEVLSDDATMDIVLSNLILKSDHTIGWRCNIDVLIKHFDAITSFPQLERKKYYGPAFFIGGQFSEYLPPDDLPFIRGLFPQAVITYIPKTSHNLQIDDPKSFLELVIPLLKYLAYKMHGEKKGSLPILVLHGLLGSKRNWESLSKKMFEIIDRTVMAVDARNHGESEHHDTHTYFDLASDVNHLMDKLSINRADLVGHSMGGRTAMVLALNEPSRVSKLVVVDISPVSTASALSDFIPNLLEAMKRISFRGFNNLNDARTHAKKILLQSKVIDADSIGFVLMNVVSKDKGNMFGWACNVDVLRSHFKDIASFPDMTGKIYKGPTLFIGGGASPYIPPSDKDGIRNFFPNANFKYVPGAGHNVHAENPTDFLQIVTQFLLNK